MSMKAILILSNWLISFTALGTIDTENSSLVAVFAIFVWFAVASILLIHADRTGAMKHIFKK